MNLPRKDLKHTPCCSIHIKILIHRKLNRFDPLNSFFQVKMEFNFEAILKAVENTVARVFGEWIIFMNISDQVSNH